MMTVMMRTAPTLPLLFLMVSLPGCEERATGLWLTPDQQGARLLEAGEYRAAAERCVDPAWQGAALYRAGEFETAAAAFGRLATAEGAFNRGNALVMQGKYEEAVASYDRALELREAWSEAEGNRRLAILRRDRMAPPEDDAGGTGGKLAADEIVFDDRAKNKKSDGEEQVEVGAGERLSDDALRALWLRRVQTRPRDFLRAKFAYQSADAAAEDGE